MKQRYSRTRSHKFAPIGFRALTLATCLLVLGSTRPALAVEIPDLEDPSADLIANRNEYGVVPIIGGDSDIGVAIGAIGSAAFFASGAKPYLWRLELNAIISFKHERSSWVYPFQDYYIKTTIPSFMHNRLRLTMRAAYTKYSTLHYWSLGNASTSDKNTEDLFNQYKLTYPHGTAELMYQFSEHLAVKVAGDYYYYLPTTYKDSLVSQDFARYPNDIKGSGKFGVWLATAGMQYDSRDNETAPHSGQFHTLSARGSPGGSRHAPYRFAGGNLAFRGYVPIWNPYLTLAGRLAADVWAGDVPFFNLAEGADGYTVGGVTGVRGVPAQRYYGKRKVYGNLELRVQFPGKKVRDQEVVWGFVTFADAGRVWAKLTSAPELDGTGLGIKYGVGGGVRLQWGTTFVLRGDAAWSPDSNPVAFYFNVGHIF